MSVNLSSMCVVLYSADQHQCNGFILFPTIDKTPSLDSGVLSGSSKQICFHCAVCAALLLELPGRIVYMGVGATRQLTAVLAAMSVRLRDDVSGSGGSSRSCNS